MSVESLMVKSFGGTTEIAEISQISPAQNTWYTVLDSLESGFLKKIRVAVDGANNYAEIRITTDGNVKTITPNLLNRAFSNNSTNFLNVTFDDYYNQSIKIEVRQTLGGSVTYLDAYVNRQVI